MASRKANSTVLSDVVDYQNPYFKVHKKEIAYPGSSNGTYWVVDKRGDCAIAIPLLPGNKTVLIGQYRIPAEYFSWEFPMGSVKEKFGLEVAKQELREETGLVGHEWEKIGECYLANGWCTQKSVVFVAKDLQQEETAREVHEFLEMKELAIEDIHKMIIDGTIKDGLTISAYFYLLEYLKNS